MQERRRNVTNEKAVHDCDSKISHHARQGPREGVEFAPNPEFVPSPKNSLDNQQNERQGSAFSRRI